MRSEGFSGCTMFSGEQRQTFLQMRVLFNKHVTAGNEILVMRVRVLYVIVRCETTWKFWLEKREACSVTSKSIVQILQMFNNLS